MILCSPSSVVLSSRFLMNIVKDPYGVSTVSPNTISREIWSGPTSRFFGDVQHSHRAVSLLCSPIHHQDLFDRFPDQRQAFFSPALFLIASFVGFCFKAVRLFVVFVSVINYRFDRFGENFAAAHNINNQSNNLYPASCSPPQKSSLMISTFSHFISHYSAGC